jgi:hypothetical protein
MNPTPGVAGRRRPVVVATVLAALALGGVASVLVHGHGAPPASVGAARGAAGQPGAVSSAWFCAGPLPVGTPGEVSSLAIVNPGGRPLGATVMIVPVTGAPTTEKISVPATGQSVVGFAAIRRTSFAAARVIITGGTAEVAEHVAGATGLEASACTDESAATQYLAAGSTQAHNNLAISLFNPGATPAVASVTFATLTGSQSPPAFQGVLVAAGHTVVLNAAHALPFKRFVSATVTASGGAIVAGALDVVGSRGAEYDALESAVATPATHWYFAAAPAGTSAQQTFDLDNPGKRTAEVEISLGGPSGVGKIALGLGPGATTRYTPAADESATALRWASVTSTNEVPIVAARELYLGTALAAPRSTAKGAAARRRQELLSLPTLPVGLTVDSGAHQLAKDWIVAGGESDRRVSEFVTVANPSGAPAEVVIRGLGGGLAGPGPLRVAPAGSVVVDLADLSGVAGRLSLRVTADEPVVVGGELYSRVARGSPGLTALAAFPVG